MVEKPGNLEWSTFGRYALLEKIGSGGMAEIYRAKTFGAAGFEKEFAIKMILPSLLDDTEFVSMFINEAKIAVSLYHANVVQVFDLGEFDGQYYIAMEFVYGKDLLDVLARCASLELKIPLDLVLFITMEYLKGLDFAHRAKNSYGEDLNIIHRDVSPSNVMMSYAGEVKIGDFGVAKAAIQRNLTETGTLKGKVGYMSPEQVVGDEIDARSDIFSAGIVFFEALSMSRLFVGNSDLDVMLRVRDADVESSMPKTGPLPSQLEQIVRKALSKHREERFQTAGQFYQALMDFCYQHRIKVTSNELSNFMRRLFAEEIEQEKSRRISEEVHRDDQMAAAAMADAAEINSQARPAFVSPKKSTGGRKVDTDGFDSVSKPEIAEADASSYRYKDEAGLIFGPMGHETLVKLIEDRPPEAADRISIDGGDWVEPADVEEIRTLVEDSTPSGGAAKSVPVGAGVYKPKRRRAEVGAEDTVRDSDSESYADSLSEPSAPVVEEPPEPTPPETAEEAREAIHELRQQYASYEGNLASTSIARLLARLHRSKDTGRLHVQREDVEKSIYLDDGEPILVDSNKEDELLGSFLLSREIISREELEEGLERLSEWGGRLGDALVAIGAIPAHEIFKHLSEQMREKILDIFTWEEAEYGYFENQEPETHGYPLGIDAYGTIVEGCLERMKIDRIRRFYENRGGVAMHTRSDTPIALDELRLSSKALRVVNHFKSGDSLEKLLGELPDKETEFVYRVVYLLHQVEYLTFEHTDNRKIPGKH